MIFFVKRWNKCQEVEIEGGAGITKLGFVVVYTFLASLKALTEQSGFQFRHFRADLNSRYTGRFTTTIYSSKTLRPKLRPAKKAGLSVFLCYNQLIEK